jgi:hypothetical protein
MNAETIVRFAHVCELESAFSKDIGRINGLINAENFFRLMNILGIESNPRMPKESSVTRDICGTLEDSPELFHFMSKGILISASKCTALERNRYRIDLDNNNYAQPGVLDGGHNTFAIAKHLLSFTMEQSDWRAIKDWESLVIAWGENQAALEALFKISVDKDDESLGLKFLIPMEVIYPRDPSDTTALNSWGESHRDITHARNNNAQLTDSTKDHHQGFYDYLKSCISEPIRKKIEWKTNDGGTIKAADVAALALIPLSKLPVEIIGLEVNAPKLYNSKQYCVETFRQILEKDGCGEWLGQTYELKDARIKSALDLVPDIIKLYDYVYKSFPKAYNEAGGSFGRIEGVKIYSAQPQDDKKKYSKKPFFTKYLDDSCDYQYADGFIIPIIVGLRELIRVNPDGKLDWTMDPKAFLSEKLPKILVMYSSIIKFAKWDPQKIGKDRGSYEIVAGAIQMTMSN